MIKQDTIRTIVDTARIDEVISEFVSLKKRGGNFIGLCPFHNEKTPSFTVSPAKGIYKCFGCGKAGDVVKFVMEHDQLSYPEALRFLAGKYGIEVEEEQKSEEAKQAESLRESLFLVNKFAAEQFSKNLWEDEKGRAVGLSYFINRGFDEKTIKQFELGYCKEERGHFSEIALEKGYKGEYLEKTGLSLNKDGKYIDRFWGRIMFPIHNLSGRVIGFGGRTLRSDKKTAKYVNSPESDLYNKSRELYGLFFAKRDIVNKDEVYLVEGYTDVVSMFQSGITNVVAPLGTSLTEDQIKLIRRYTKNVVLLFDGDEAGLKATSRAIDMLLQEGMNASAVVFPDGQDPDSYSKEHSDDELLEFLNKGKKNFISFHLEHNLDSKSDDPVKKAGMMKEILASIAKIPDHMLRSLFITDFAQKSGLNEKSCIFEVNRLRRGDLKKAYQSDTVIPDDQEKFTAHNEEEKDRFERTYDNKERKILELMFRYGEEHVEFKLRNDSTKIEVINMLVYEYIINEIEKDDISFKNEVYHKILEVFKLFIDAEKFPDLRFFINHKDDEVRNTCIDFMTEPYELSENWSKKYHIYTTLEKDHLLTSVNRALYALKLSEVLIRLSESEEKLKEANEEEVVELLQQQKLLSEAKKALANKLGMTLN